MGTPLWFQDRGSCSSHGEIGAGRGIKPSEQVLPDRRVKGWVGCGG